MIKKIILLFLNLLFNNWLILKFKSIRFKVIDYNYDFLNISFENDNELKDIFFSKKFFNKNIYDEKRKNYHTFGWLNVAKKIGGAKNISLAKRHIFGWYNNKYKINSFVWDNQFIAKRILNLIYNFDFYAVSASDAEKIIIKKIILKHYFVLKLQMKLETNINNHPIEISKAFLLFNLIHKINIEEVLKKINNQLVTHVNTDGVHNSFNPCYQAEFINEMYEIKNILLYFGYIVPKAIEFHLINMSAVLKNMFHQDNTIALFNGANNANIEAINKINHLQKDIKTKNLNNPENGLAIYKINKLKIFFDITKPTNKLLNQNLHSGTLSFEMSYDNEKIITNCGSIEKRIGRKPEFLRFSAAHSTIIINNTNISELVEKKSYKRVPEKIIFNKNENEQYILCEGLHDGYKNNFKYLVKRKLKIDKKIPKISGNDNIIATKNNLKKSIYNIRFHLTQNCKCSLTNNKKSVLIKTNLNNSWIFESENKLTLEDSININDGKKIYKTKQIVISGYIFSSKKIEQWSISKMQ